jgi:GntR family transcriptional regulator, transcriptional repressor for pyruvate dehydrogenase complex
VAITQLKPIGKPRLAVQVAQSLRTYILESHLETGDRLPSERDLASALAVSRHVVREAIRILEEEGLVMVGHGKDTVVQRLPIASALVESLPLHSDFDESTIEARAIFEAGLAECLVERVTAEDLERLDAIVFEMRRRVQLGHPGNEDDLVFHSELHRCTYNSALINIGRAVVLANIRNQLIRLPVVSLLERPEEVYPEDHAEIVSSIRARDVEALRHSLRIHPYRRHTRER